MKRIIKKVLAMIDIELLRPTRIFNNKVFEIKKDFQVTSEFAINLLVNSYEVLKKMDKHFIKISILKENSDSLLIKVNSFKLIIESVEDIFILSEVLIDKDYNFIDSDKYVFMDIGFNIGITSLFLSQKKNISHIYGYEPVEYTYNIALSNIEKNSTNKISLKNIGLGGYTRKEVFSFNKNLKGNSGLRGDLSYSIKKLKPEQITKIDVDIVDVYDEFNKVFISHPDTKIGLKIDCEGAEYELISRLSTANLLEKVNVLIIEWHDKGAKELENILLDNGFKIFSRVLEINSGIIYATR